MTGAKSATFTNVSAAVESADHGIMIDGRYVNGVTLSTGFALYGNKEATIFQVRLDLRRLLTLTIC